MNSLLLLPSFIFFLCLFFVPVGFLFVMGIRDLSASVFQDAYLLYVVRFTYWQAMISASLSVVLGLFSAVLVKEWKIWGGKTLWKFSLLCSSLPPIIVALGILGSWGNQVNIFGWKGILLGHVFLNVAIPFRLIGNSLSEREYSSEATAQSLGLSRWGIFWKITFVSIRASIVSSWILAFLYSSTSLFIVMFLGGGPRFTSLEVALYEAIKLNLDNGRAIQIAIFQAVIGVVLFFIYLQTQKRRKLEGDRMYVPIFVPKKRWVQIVGAGILWVLLFLILGLPLISIFWEGLTQLPFLDKGSLLESSLTTFGISIAVVFFSLLILYPYLHFVYQARSDSETSGWVWLVAAPQFFSPLVICLALSVYFPLVRESSWLSYSAVIAIQTMFVIPLMQFPLREGFLRLSKERNWIAQSLGAGAWQRFLFVEVPFMKRSLFLSALIGFGFSMGEVVSILLFSPPNINTLALNIFQAMSRYRFQEARATTLVLLLVMICLFSVVGHLEDTDESSSR